MAAKSAKVAQFGTNESDVLTSVAFLRDQTVTAAGYTFGRFEGFLLQHFQSCTITPEAHACYFIIVEGDVMTHSKLI